MLKTLSSVDDDEPYFYMVPRDRKTFTSISNRFSQMADSVASGINIFLAKFCKEIDEGFGVFRCGKALFVRIQRAIRACKLKLEVYVENHYSPSLIGNSATFGAEIEEKHSRPVRGRVRPTVRHNNALVTAKSFNRR